MTAYCILRVPILYGKGESAVSELIDIVRNQNCIKKMDNYNRRYPTNVSDVAHVIKQIIGTT